MSIEDHLDHVRRPGRPATTVRIALWCARHRWLVLALWLLVMAGLLDESSALGGDKLQSAMGTGDSRTEAQKGMDSFATAGKDDPGQSLWLVISAGQRTLTDPAPGPSWQPSWPAPRRHGPGWGTDGSRRRSSRASRARWRHQRWQASSPRMASCDGRRPDRGRAPDHRGEGDRTPAAR